MSTEGNGGNDMDISGIIGGRRPLCRVAALVLVVTASVTVSCDAFRDAVGKMPEDFFDNEEELGYVLGGDKDISFFYLGDLQKEEGAEKFVGWLDDSQTGHLRDTLFIQQDTIVLSPGDTLFQAADTIVTEDFINYARRRLDYYFDPSNANEPDKVRNDIPVYVKYSPQDANISRVTIESSDTSVVTVRRTDRPLKFILKAKNLGDCDITVTLEGNNVVRKKYPVRVTHTAYIVFYVSRLADLLDSDYQKIDYKISNLPDKWYPLVMYFQDSLTVFSQVSGQRWDEEAYALTGMLRNTPFEERDTVVSPLRRHIKVIHRSDIVHPSYPLGMRRRQYRDVSDIAFTDREGKKFVWYVKDKEFEYTEVDYRDGKLVFNDTSIIEQKVVKKGYRWEGVMQMGVDLVCDIPYVDFVYAVKLNSSNFEKEFFEYLENGAVLSDDKAQKTLSVVFLDNGLTERDEEMLRKAAEHSKQLIKNHPADSAKWFFDLSEYGIDVDYVWDYSN